ncbi:pentatricopeptide repeat-containing protein-like, mitochondrial [Iris pallida]|uniref:Pentatricopeptide repeat-containing protein-like, mitochondrial n=1 Tax=Iris pallida TaxID=29817 RepID=A0AAX6EXB8_IRIPA|nr:pentatricopeptide repeat-containing protein-like, mitochondrial [Iris pallida]
MSIRRASAALRSLVPAVGPPAASGNSLYRRLSSPDERVAETLDRWSAEGGKVTAPHLMKHVRALCKFRRHKEALEVLDWMETKGVMSSGGHTVRLNLVSKVMGIDAAEDYLASLSEPIKHQLTYGALLNCYCTKRIPDKAITLYKKMKELNIVPDTLGYNHLLSLYMKLGQYEKVRDLYQDMKASNISPDNCGFRILIKSFASMDDIDSVEKTIQDMEGSLVPFDWSTYCQLADVYNSAGLFEKAEVALNKAELVMGSRDLSPFPLLIKLYAGAGNLVQVKQVWKLLKARSPRPTNRLYLVMLQALAKLDDMDALKHCFEEWEGGCVNYDMRLVNVVIGAYLRKDLVEEAKLLQKNARERGVLSDLQTQELFKDYYSKYGELESDHEWSEAATSMVKRADGGGD